MALATTIKQTEVGPLPGDWDVVPLGRLVRSVEYGSSAKSVRQGEFPVLRMGNLQDGRIVWDDLVFTNDRSEFERYRLRPGDVLFNRTNTIDLVGKTSLFDARRDALFAGYLIRVLADPEKLDSRYLSYILNTPVAKRHSQRVLSVAIGQANINGQKLRAYPIPLPPTRAEQEVIAEALADADAWIESLEKLIAKKRQIKQGVMQQLLTGKRRLPEFRGEWHVRRVADLAALDPESLGGDTRPDYEFSYISLEDVDHGRLRGCSLQRFASAPSRARRRLRLHDVLVATVRPNLLSHLLFSSAEPDWVCSTGFCVVRWIGSQADPYFMFSQFFSGGICRQIDALISGSNYPAISSRDVGGMQIPVPPPDEQRAIGAVLRDADTELSAFEAKLTKARLVKQGMMQTLLTGKVRLV